MAARPLLMTVVPFAGSSDDDWTKAMLSIATEARRRGAQTQDLFMRVPAPGGGYATMIADLSLFSRDEAPAAIRQITLDLNVNALVLVVEVSMFSSDVKTDEVPSGPELGALIERVRAEAKPVDAVMMLTSSMTKDDCILYRRSEDGSLGPTMESCPGAFGGRFWKLMDARRAYALMPRKEAAC